MEFIHIQAILTVALVIALVLYRKGFFERFRKMNRLGLESSSLYVGSYEIPYVESGDKERPTVLLLPGFAGFKDDWIPFVLELVGKQYHVVAMDLPGFGDSTKDANTSYDPLKLTKIVRAFVRGMDIQAFHIIGHSVGAMVAAGYAYASPTEILSLTMVEPFGVGTPYESDLDKQVAQGRNPLIITSAGAYTGLMKFLAAQPLEIDSKDAQARGEALVRDIEQYRRAWKEIREGERSKVLDLILPVIEKRTHAVFGARSRVVHPATSKIVKPMRQKGETVVSIMPDCGHLPHMEKPSDLADRCVLFFKGQV